MKPERMNELEEKIDELKSISLNELAKLNYSLKDISFILRAILMPINEITEYIAIYDGVRPRLDELAFVKDLSNKYHTDSKSIVSRIREVRKINKYRKEVSKITR